MSLQSCLTLCDPMDYSQPGSSGHGILQDKNTGVGCHFLLQGMFPAEESNLGFLCLLHWQVGSLPLAPPGKSYQSEWPSSKKKKNLQTINAGEDVEKREPSCTVGKNINWYITMENNVEIPLKIRNKVTIWPSNPTTGQMPWQNHNSKRHVYPKVHCSTGYNIQVMEAT